MEFHGRQGSLSFILEYFERLRTNRVMISCLDFFQDGAKGYHIYFFKPTTREW